MSSHDPQAVRRRFTIRVQSFAFACHRPVLRQLPPKGFTLVEIMVLVVIVGLLAIMALPAFQRARISTQNTRLANDLRIFKQGFENYSLDTGAWPPEVPPGELPSVMAGYIVPANFEMRTVVGGRYDWDFEVGSFTAGVSIVDSFLDATQASAVDAMVDDGNLATGAFVMNGADYSLVLEP